MTPPEGLGDGEIPADHFRFAHDDAAYLFGALEPDERAAFEEHLERCSACTRGVERLRTTTAALASVRDMPLDRPGGPDPVEQLDSGPPPDDLLPTLLRRAAEERRQRRRRTTRALAALAGVAAAALVAAGVAAGWGGAGGDQPPPVAGRAMSPARAGIPITATAALQPAAWGTRITLHCQYEGRSSYSPQMKPEVEYGLRVVDTSGHAHDLGSWTLTFASGAEADFTSGTSLAPDEIRRVEIVRGDTTPVLALRL